MCGIAGILRFDGYDPVPLPRLLRMRDALSHRGPDEAGTQQLGNLGLAHRRLTIIDRGGGRQPMANPDGSVWISYNGEVYNHRELRAELSERGCRFRTRSDTEVVLQAYEVFGDACVERLRGMFAFAIWDQPRGRLLLARDRLGIKPLYYATNGSELLFASEIKAIHAAGGITPELNHVVLPEFLATRSVAGAETMLRGVRKLLPGHTLSWSAEQGFRERRYWRLPAVVDDGRRLPDIAAGLRERLFDSVRAHLISDVPLGVFLSGGLDSSGLAAIMAGMLDGPVRSFAVGFGDPACDELDYARLAADAIGAEHREVVVTPAEFFGALPRLIWHEDEPIAFPSSVPLYFVSRLASASVKVVLTGEGADELFLGYNRYRVAAWNLRLGRPYWALLPPALRARIGAALAHLPQPVARRLRRSFLATAPGLRAQFYENFSTIGSALQRELLRAPAQFDGADAYAEGMRCIAEGSGSVLDRMGQADLQTYLVELLMKQDQMSMAASLESRVPYLDHPFVEHVAALPARAKLGVWRTKLALREALRDLVPRPILERPKRGFPVPIGAWLRGPSTALLDELLLGTRATARGLFEPAVLRRLVQEHRDGRADHADRLWLLLNLELWQRLVIDGEPVGSITAAAPGPRRRRTAPAVVATTAAPRSRAALGRSPEVRWRNVP